MIQIFADDYRGRLDVGHLLGWSQPLAGFCLLSPTGLLLHFRQRALVFFSF